MSECHQVFISYSHETPEHKQAVLGLAGGFVRKVLMRSHFPYLIDLALRGPRTSNSRVGPHALWRSGESELVATAAIPFTAVCGALLLRSCASYIDQGSRRKVTFQIEIQPVPFQLDCRVGSIFRPVH